MFNLADYQTKLKEHGYRKDVVTKVKAWDRSKLILFLDNVSEEQGRALLPDDIEDMSTPDLRKLTCLVVWSWGWEGTDYFLQMYS